MAGEAVAVATGDAVTAALVTFVGCVSMLVGYLVGYRDRKALGEDELARMRRECEAMRWAMRCSGSVLLQIEESK